ncbi:MAG: T9SS type A sorting domain-containing protein, partial [Bacteroidales bacterium]|nr:T9SS type A sorting domain-containing protein [Bacteroidales bacterium]
VNTGAYEGTYCAKSGSINDNQSTYLELEYDVFSDDVISFWFKVSSENNYDYLRFFIDGNEQASWAGEVGWQEAEYAVTGGIHTFKWEYDKDYSVSNGSDCGWVDFIVLPAPQMAALNASFTSDITTVCESETVNFVDASSGGAVSWSWTFEGGTPGTSNIQNPTVAYLTAGTYDVTLEVSDGIETASLTIEDYITVSTAPDVPGTPIGITEVCANWGNSTYTTSGSTGADTYDWVLEPSTAGTISGAGTSVIIDWEEGFLGDVTLKVAAENDCGMSAYSSMLDINVYLPEVTLDPFDDVCLTWPAFELTGGMPEGGVYSGAGVDNGWFDPSTAGLGTHTITYTYEDPNSCSNFSEETILVDPCPGIGENIFNQDVLIFPNPNNGSFTLELKLEKNEVVEISIYNALNEVVFGENNVSTKDYSNVIDLSNYAQGIYYLRIKGEETNVVKKIIIRN